LAEEEGEFAVGGKTILQGQKSCVKKQGRISKAKNLCEKSGLYKLSLLGCKKFLN
jgi:hypothetical protein